jgi:hypothetical protein
MHLIVDKVLGRVYGEFIEIDVKEWNDEKQHIQD